MTEQINLDTPENYPTVNPVTTDHDLKADAGKLELFEQLGCMPELALEAHDLLRGQHGGEIPGVSLTEEHSPFATIHTVEILNEQGSHIMQKPMGSYVTIFTDALQINHHGVHQTLADTVTKYLQPFLNAIGEEDCVLIAGLGNWNATPDALGPRTVGKLMATRHLHGNVPEDVLEGVRPVVTITPGVLGMTGVESAEMISGVVERVQPKLLIVVDALAAGDSSRIGTTIQITDTGIRPGAGVANARANIHADSLGIPVVAIGIPTVVNARLIALQILEQYQATLMEQMNDRRLPHHTQHAMKTALKQCPANLEVTPKEIDDIVNNCSTILAKAITQALHPDMNEDFAESFF